MFSLAFVLQMAFVHWFSDFVLQSSWMATNKSNNWWALSAHVATYTTSLMVLMIAIGLVIEMSFGIVIIPNTPQQFFYWVAINGALHFITDAITSRLTSRMWKKGDMHNFL